MKTVNIGGDRLGSGAKMNVTMHGYERSNHDLSYLWKSTLSPGTLVPFLTQIALPGDTFDIDLNCLVKTMPTIGPLFGSFKIQLDVFAAPIRLYNKLLHNNKLGVGMDMSKILLPLINLTGEPYNFGQIEIPLEFQQVNQSSLLAYLGIRGLGRGEGSATPVTTKKNALGLLAYWDIFKNYYANKQEENAYVIHGEPPVITSFQINGDPLPFTIAHNGQYVEAEIIGTGIDFDNVNIVTTYGTMNCKLLVDWGAPHEFTTVIAGKHLLIKGTVRWSATEQVTASEVTVNTNLVRPNLYAFPLENIDKMRDMILEAPSTTAFTIADDTLIPYSLINQTIVGVGTGYSMNSLFSQEGLAAKTYQSDIFNNWLKSEWIEGPGSIADITKISTAGNSFTIDTLNLSKKVYDMLNRIAVSGGSYEDWLGAVYDHESKWRAETPVYHGGLSKELVFQEIVSVAATQDEPLGSLAGKGIMTDKHKGGHLIINIDEPSLIMGIISITPRISYSQGNEWWTGSLLTLDDLHKPALDGIGYQDLLTDQMAWWDTAINGSGVATYNSAGKQPAWMNYMTNFDRNYGNFADSRSQMFMTLDRRYEPNVEEGELAIPAIKDLTTYIDPAKFNYAFAQTDVTAMNFWTQIAVNMQARRKMSAKIIPNL